MTISFGSILDHGSICDTALLSRAVPWGKETVIEQNEWEGVYWFVENSNKNIFRKGQSKSMWNEFWKFIDFSDVILYVIDASDAPGTTCQMIAEHVTKNAKHKHLICGIIKLI